MRNLIIYLYKNNLQAKIVFVGENKYRMMEILENFVETLNELVEERGVKQKDLAKAIGMPPASVCRYMRGMVIPTPSVLTAIADYFHCSTDFLVGFEKQHDATDFKPRPPFSQRLKFLLEHYGYNAYAFCKKSDISDSCFYS